MRILISTWSLQVGGGEVLAMNLAAELCRRGHDVFVFNQRAELIDPALVARLLPPQVKVLSMADNPRSTFWSYKVNALQQRLGRPATFYKQRQQAYLADCLQRYRIELVNSHATVSDEICAPLTQRLGIPFVITEHGEYNKFLLEGRRDFAPVLRTAERILAVSRYCQHNLEQALPDLPLVQTVYNGVVTKVYDAAETRRTLHIPAEAFVFGMVARGIEDKGWKYAIQAFQQVKAAGLGRPLRLVLVGGSSYLQSLQAEFGSDTDIIFTGQVPNPDFFVAGFDVGLLPTYFRAEALPLAIIEYMVTGKPTIATRVGGIPELIEPTTGPTGQLVDIEPATYTPNLAMLTAAMRRYCTEPALYAAHVQNCQRASTEFTMENCAAQYEHAFEQAVTTKSMPGR
ncbi:glycosyltransferase family 4 protein [Hymenobacter lucidus]|uniref:Glycosyltransferase family 4 protein n=1 Tax=Hymenobacter lucidus TaxID=2880930 RepID=A0ABS8AQK8_9BACT|nr:glycosyltransferase family 4 protein [Hymenobacter lucidus]MCB2408503.1 glycosyltransferase family 4 protein [Hymenobacter lucidus]